MRLLVVDDSAVTRAMIKRTVAAAGLPVRTPVDSRAVPA